MSLLASVVIPCRDEAADIEACLDRVAEQDVGAGRLEVILADGRSEDETVSVAVRAAARHGFGRFEVVDNPQRRTAAGLHRALAEVSTDYVIRVDARSRIGPEHVRRATTILADHPEVGVVGGAQVPIDRGAGTMSAGIARALSNRYTTGLSRYRRTQRSGPADTVWMGAFRTADLRALGGWDPDYGVNEDYELNSRFRAAGRTVWFDGELQAGYLPRGDLRSLAKQYFSFGRSKGAQWAAGGRPALRQAFLVVVPPLAGGALAVGVRAVGAPRAAIVGIGIVAAVDQVGVSGSAGRPSVRLAAMAATVTFPVAWWVGVVVGWARRPRTWKRGERVSHGRGRDTSPDLLHRVGEGGAVARSTILHGDGRRQPEQRSARKGEDRE